MPFVPVTQVEKTPKVLRLKKDENGYERIVYGELLLPETPNYYNDYHTKTSVREFAYSFLANGFFIDEEHDNVDISDRVHVVESWIARKGDPDFIEGAWVVGMYVGDDELWEKILRGDITGFSYEAMVTMEEAEVEAPSYSTVVGFTEPDLVDKHVHRYFVLLDEDGMVLSGGTLDDDTEHNHTIRRSSFTEEAENHLHIYNYIEGSRKL